MMTVLVGAAIGLTLGLTGAGGSMLAIPLLTFGLGWSLTQAAPVALIAVCAASAAGTVAAWRKAEVRYRAALLMSAAGACASPFGFALAHWMSHELLASLFAIVAWIVAVRMFRQATNSPLEASIVRAAVPADPARSPASACAVDVTTGRLKWTPRCAAILAAVGTFTGLLSGLLGVGGGFVVVPSLRSATDLSMQSAVATSLMVVALTSGGAVAVHALQGAPLPTALAAPFVVGALLGMGASRILAPRVAGARLQQAFAVLLVSGGMALAAQAMTS